MSKKKLSVLIDFMFKILPMFILFICIFSTWKGASTIAHCYNSLSFDLSYGFLSANSILINFDIFNLNSVFVNIVQAINVDFVVNEYTKFIFIYFGYFFFYEVLKLLYYCLVFIFKIFSKFIEKEVL